MEKKINKKINKKKLMLFILPIFAIALVSAVAVYYDMFSATFNVTPAINVEGEEDFTVPENAIGGETIIGDSITITNDAPSLREILITDDSGEDVDVSYLGTLELTKKTVDFNLDVWEVLNGANNKVQVEYTIVGDEFSAVAKPHLTSEQYVLIYYADAKDRFVNPEKAILVEDVLGNLPYIEDENAEGNTYNYCLTNEYDTCHGAKIWYVPNTAINGDKTLDWSRASEFYFESSLIQYNAEGHITIYPNEELDITPTYTPSDYLEGEVTITTTIA